MDEQINDLEEKKNRYALLMLPACLAIMIFASSLLDDSHAVEPLREGASAEVQRLAEHYGLPRLQVESDFREVDQNFTALKATYRLKYGY